MTIRIIPSTVIAAGKRAKDYIGACARCQVFFPGGRSTCQTKATQVALQSSASCPADLDGITSTRHPPPITRGCDLLARERENLTVGVLAQACGFAGACHRACSLHGCAPINERPVFRIPTRACQEKLCGFKGWLLSAWRR